MDSDNGESTGRAEIAFCAGAPILVAGLGNPEPKYLRTPHNLGFLTLDELQRRWGAPRRAEARFRGETASARLGDWRVHLLAPTTYMNLSGEAVGALCDYYGIPPENALVVCDDHDLPWGRLRLRAEGGTGGHKGLASIEQRLGTQRYPRLRIGIRPSNVRGDLAGYVLSPFHGEGLEWWPVMTAAAADAIETAVREGLRAAMTRFNGLNLAAKDCERSKS
mgnify:CR=1 FL=1